MNENLVEWTLLKEENYLQSCIKDFKISNKIFQQFTTDFGRIDFAHITKNKEIIITELETIINSNAKFHYCIEQVKSYRNIKLSNELKHRFIILFAEQTPNSFYQRIKKFCEDNSTYFYTYDLEKVKLLYEKEIRKALINIGAPLAKPVAMNLTHLSSLNRLFFKFFETGKDILKKKDFKKEFPAVVNDTTETVFNITLNGACFFDLLTKERDCIMLTEYGKRFRENLHYLKGSNIRRIPLSLEQKRVLIESLINGNFYKSKIKINIYYFMRFLILTQGEWIPRGRNFADQDKEKIKLVNSIFGTDYKEGTICNLISFTANHCVELEMIEKIKTSFFYDKAKITSLGSRILNLMDSFISLKRESVQIPLQLDGETND